MADVHRKVCDFCGLEMNEHDTRIDFKFRVHGSSMDARSASKIMGADFTKDSGGYLSFTRFLRPHDYDVQGEEWKTKQPEKDSSGSVSAGCWELCHKCGWGIVQLAIEIRDRLAIERIEGKR